MSDAPNDDDADIVTTLRSSKYGDIWLTWLQTGGDTPRLVARSSDRPVHPSGADLDKRIQKAQRTRSTASEIGRFIGYVILPVGFLAVMSGAYLLVQLLAHLVGLH